MHYIYLYLIIIHNVPSLYDQQSLTIISVNTIEQSLFSGKNV